MQAKSKQSSGSRFVRREAAERYLFLTLLSFAASVSLTRLFLSMTGYPQIGGGELHIAHVLWGGLLLFAAALLPLIFANHWAFSASAILSGVGVGLFIDEVGKFITQKNDYFYPTAAPIIYTFFIITMLVFLRVRRFRNLSPHAELHRALGEIRNSLETSFEPDQQAQLHARLERISADNEPNRYTILARSLIQFMEIEEEAPPAPPRSPWWRSRLKVPQAVRYIFSMKVLRALLVVGFLTIGLLSLKNPASVLLSGWLPPQLQELLGNLHLGRQIEVASAPFWFNLRIWLEISVGGLLLISTFLMLVGQNRAGSTLAFVALILSLTTVNLLLFYFEQFSTIITTTFQFLILAGTYSYRQRLLKADPIPA